MANLPKNWKNSKPYLLLLSKFLYTNTINSFDSADYWKPVLNEQPEKIIRDFIKEGYLIPSPLENKLDYSLKFNDLIKVLKDLNLKVTGKKEELVNRLIENNKEKAFQITKTVETYICSEIGNKLVIEFIENEKIICKNMELDVIKALKHKDFLKASKSVAEYESKQVFSKGIGIDWKNYNSQRDIEILNFIFSSSPNILTGIKDELINNLRLVASFTHLCGTKNIKNYFDINIITSIKLDFNTSVRMLLSHASYLDRIKDYKAANINKTQIIGCGNESCSECQKINNKIFNIEQTPTLPYDKCTNEKGCRCTVGAYLELSNTN